MKDKALQQNQEEKKGKKNKTKDKIRTRIRTRIRQDKEQELGQEIKRPEDYNIQFNKPADPGNDKNDMDIGNNTDKDGFTKEDTEGQHKMKNY